MKTLHLTERGLRGLQDDSQMSPDARLIAEIVKRCPNIGLDNLNVMFHQLTQRFGVDRAIVAVKAGEVIFEPAKNHRSPAYRTAPASQG
jgi:hypothetical protein